MRQRSIKIYRWWLLPFCFARATWRVSKVEVHDFVKSIVVEDLIPGTNPEEDENQAQREWGGSVLDRHIILWKFQDRSAETWFSYTSVTMYLTIEEVSGGLEVRFQARPNVPTVLVLGIAGFLIYLSFQSHEFWWMEVAVIITAVVIYLITITRCRRISNDLIALFMTMHEKFRRL